jgi:hypothetical protein
VEPTAALDRAILGYVERAFRSHCERRWPGARAPASIALAVAALCSCKPPLPYKVHVNVSGPPDDVCKMVNAEIIADGNQVGSVTYQKLPWSEDVEIHHDYRFLWLRVHAEINKGTNPCAFTCSLGVDGRTATSTGSSGQVSCNVDLPK